MLLTRSTFGICATSLAMMACTTTPEPTGDSYRADVERIVTEIARAGAFKQVVTLIAPALRAELSKGRTGMNDRTLDILASEFASYVQELASDPARLTDLMLPAIRQEFSHDEIRQILAFHVSPAGRKWARFGNESRFHQVLGEAMIKDGLPEICRKTNARLARENLARLPAGACRGQ